MQNLAEHAQRLSKKDLRELLADTDRNQRLSFEALDILVDLSHQRLDTRAFEALLQHATDQQLEDWIGQLYSGAPVNNTEQRAALHMALRATPGDHYADRDQDVIADVLAERERMLDFAEAVRKGSACGATGKQFRRVVNIGIGGSDLGVQMACHALSRWCSPDLELHFVSGIDGVELHDAISGADAATTLFIVCSKSFTTLETMDNARLAREWLGNSLGDADVARHMIAVSANRQAMTEFGVNDAGSFHIWDWVGGRYSLWSSMGMALAIAIGKKRFLEFLAGGREMDIHFRDSGFDTNLPVMLALVGYWNTRFFDSKNHVILPYDQRLAYLPRYLQQLIMESLGKAVTRDGSPVELDTGVAVWGEPGSNAQHAFMQLLHQGNIRCDVDFVAPAQGSSEFEAQHAAGVAQCVGQAQALAIGRTEDEICQELSELDVPADLQRLLAPHKVQPGNRSSTLIMLPRVDPLNLGRLIALYEHRVFVQSVLWGINPFDQFGVELGKRLARQPLPEPVRCYLARHAGDPAHE